MKSTIKNINTLLLTTIVILSGWLSGCGSYYVTADGQWTVYEEHVVVETTYLPVFDRLLFEVRWDDDVTHLDLDVSVTTPLDGLVIDDGFEIDRCFFLGTYTDHFDRVSEIECLDPFFGLFDLNIDNPDHDVKHASITITEEYDNGRDIIQEVYTRDETIYAFDTIILSYNY